MNINEDLVRRYFQFQYDVKSTSKSKRVNADVSVHTEVMKMCENKDDGLSIVSELIEAAETDELISNIAAGPLEELLNIHGQAIQKELEILVRKSFKMRKAIQGVWASGKTREVLDQILDKFDLTYGSF